MTASFVGTRSRHRNQLPKLRRVPQLEGSRKIEIELEIAIGRW
jgi:hypothetical protein